MKKILFLFIICLFSLHTYSQKYVWDNVIQVNTNNYAYSGAFLTMDENDNKYIIGSFINFVAIYYDTIYTPNRGIYLAKINQNDSLLWLKKIAESDTSIGVTRHITDQENNIILNVRILKTATILDSNFVSDGGLDNVLIKLDSNGHLIFIKHLKGSCDDGLHRIAIDSHNDIIVSGSFLCDLDIGDTIFYRIGNVPNFAECYLMKLNSNGKFIWIKRNVGGGKITLDNEDNIYMVGGDVSPQYLILDNIVLNIPNDFTIYDCLVKFDKNGVAQWVRYFGQKNYPASLSSLDLIINNSNVIITGNGFSNIQNIFYFQNGGSLVGNSQVDNFIVAYDINGNFKWKKITNSIGSESFVSIGKNNEGKLFLTGSNDFDIYFDTDTIITNNTPDILELCIDSSGNDMWAISAGGTGSDATYGIAVDSKNSIYVIGGTGSSPCIFGQYYIDKYFGSIFLAKLSPNPTSIYEPPPSPFTIYPNPAENEFIISSSNALQATIILQNTMGQTLQTKKINGTSQSIETGNLPNGIYFLQIKNENTHYTHKIIIQH